MAPPSSVASILVVDDDPDMRQSLRLCLEADDARVLCVATGRGALDALERAAFDVVVLDLRLEEEWGLDVLREIRRQSPRVAVVVITGQEGSETAVEAMKLGAADYLQKPFTPDRLRKAMGSAVEARRRERLDGAEEPGWLDSASSTYDALLATAERAAASDCSVLLRGESGTGKTVLARWIHARSRRAQGPFVTVNCPDLTSELASGTLFGHKKGAFTGAVTDAPGKVQEAAGGTLFFDEVGDLGADPQARLLRLLNDRAYERVGEPRERRADVRILAATNRPLEQMVSEGRFREDLFFRLDVITLELPPLRARREDALPLARRLLTQLSSGARSFSPSAERLIASYAWPGNLRELRNAVERAAVLAPDAVIEPDDLRLRGADAGDHYAAVAAALGDCMTLEEMEREHIARVIARAPSLDAAAEILGIAKATLLRKRRRYGLA